MNIYHIKRKIKVKVFFLHQDLSYFIDDIKSKFSDIFYYPPRNLIKRIKHLIYWFPVIWKDYWWDDYYIIIILKHKLENMEHNFRFNGMTTSSESIADEIKLVINSINEYLYESEENFLSKLEEYYPSKKPNIKFKRSKFGYRYLSTKTDPNYISDLIDFNEINEAKKKILLHKIFKTLEEKNGYWWD